MLGLRRQEADVRRQEKGAPEAVTCLLHPAYCLLLSYDPMTPVTGEEAVA